jgi:glycosyltransferase involved in cell wall biosynthesis
MDNQKIILLTHEYPPKRGGAGTYCEELVYASLKIGIPIEAWVPDYATKPNDTHLYGLPIKGSQDWICSFRLFKEIKNNLKRIKQAPLLHLAEPGSLRAFIRFGWVLKKLPNLIITIHGTELIRFCKNPIEKLFFLRLLKKAKKIHVLSKFNRNQLIKLCPTIKDKILLFPGAPARNLVGGPVKDRKPAKENIRILCVARIHPRKGQDRVLQSISKLPNDLKKKIECLFVGPVVKKNFFRELEKQKERINCKISFLGDLPDQELKNIYQSSDIFILPSMPRAQSVEGFGFVYLEASSHGLAVLAHRIGGVEDAIKDGKTGILTNPEKPEELENALKTLLVDETLRAQLGDAGKEWANIHSWELVAKNLYQE